MFSGRLFRRAIPLYSLALLCSIVGAGVILAPSAFAKGEVKATAELRTQPNTYGPVRYIPAQARAADCERLPELLRRNVCGVGPLGADRMAPLENGMEFLAGQNGHYEIHYGRAGVQCRNNGQMLVRMEIHNGLKKIDHAVKVGQEIIPLSSFKQEAFRIRPGRAEYVFVHPGRKLRIRLEAVSPVAAGTYGVMCRFTAENLSGTAVKLALLSWMGEMNAVPEFGMSENENAEDFLVLDAGRENPMVGQGAAAAARFLHDTNYKMYAGFDGENATAGYKDASGVVGREVELAANSGAAVYLTVFLDSPGYDAEKIDAQVRSYFYRNAHLPADVREQLFQEAMDTFVHRVVKGDSRFMQYYREPGPVYEVSVRQWQQGCWRNQGVTFGFPDAKLQAVANMAANDWFPGIVQRPGLVHDAKYVDIWNYIFCYRHVHGASDIGLEKYALNYMRLLSCNQQPSGLIQSTMANFVTPAHPTKFDASYIDSLWHYYKWTGDVEAVRQLWPTVVNATRFIESSQDPDGDHLYRDLFNQWKSDFDDRTPSSSFQTAIVWRAYRDMAELGRVVGDEEKVAEFERKAQMIHETAMRELWSPEMVMLGPKDPLGILRLHPQSLEVEIPIWTGFVNSRQAEVLADWYFANLADIDEKGGIWMWDNDWWPAVWSQHVPAPGDYLMIGWAMFLTGRHEEGARILQTVAGGNFRNTSPGFSYIYGPDGTVGGDDPGTVQGAWTRSMVEGLFGVRPNVDEKRIYVRPRIPKDWGYAVFDRPGLKIDYRRDGETVTVDVRTNEDIVPIVELAADAPVRTLRVNEVDTDVTMEADLRWGIVSAELPAGGGEVRAELSPREWNIRTPEECALNEVMNVTLKGVETYALEDPFGFFEVLEKQEKQLRLRLKKQGCGRATAFLHCTAGNLKWIEPVHVWTMARTAKAFQARTVIEPVEDAERFVPVDLTEVYNDDIQRCFAHQWKYDSHGQNATMGYWSLPLFRLTEELPERIQVGPAPFELGSMGPGEAEKANDLLMLANTTPYELPTGARIALPGRRLSRIYLLSLNMQLPQKSYIPAAVVDVHYDDGTVESTELIAPLNFDAYYQDFAVNTIAYPLATEPAYGQEQWYIAFYFDLTQHHLTATDIVCDPSKKVEAVDIRVISTEAFYGLAGMTLLEAPE